MTRCVLLRNLGLPGSVFRTSENGFEADLLSAKYIIGTIPPSQTVLSSSECSHFVDFDNII